MTDRERLLSRLRDLSDDGVLKVLEAADKAILSKKYKAEVSHTQKTWAAVNLINLDDDAVATVCNLIKFIKGRDEEFRRVEDYFFEEGGDPSYMDIIKARRRGE